MPAVVLPPRPAALWVGAAGSEVGVPADRGTIALAGVRAARHELYRASGLLHRAIRLAAKQDVSAEQVARAAGTSVDRVRRIATELDDPAGSRANPDGRGGAC
jgi:hypothetical protein